MLSNTSLERSVPSRQGALHLRREYAEDATNYASLAGEVRCDVGAVHIPWLPPHMSRASKSPAAILFLNSKNYKKKVHIYIYIKAGSKSGPRA